MPEGLPSEQTTGHPVPTFSAADLVAGMSYRPTMRYSVDHIGIIGPETLVTVVNRTPMSVTVDLTGTIRVPLSPIPPTAYTSRPINLRTILTIDDFGRLPFRKEETKGGRRTRRRRRRTQRRRPPSI